MPKEFITIYNNNFSLIKREKQDFKLFSDDVKKNSKEDLYEKTTDFILLFEEIQESQAQNKYKSSYVIDPIFGIIFLYSVLYLNWQSALFNLFSII